MKKFYLFGILFSLVLSSCTKEYICTCTITGTVKIESYKVYNTKRKATKNCEAASNSTQSCVLESYWHWLIEKKSDGGVVIKQDILTCSFALFIRFKYLNSLGYSTFFRLEKRTKLLL